MSQTVPEKGALVGGADEVVVDLAGDITLQAANDLWFCFAFLEATFDVGLGWQVVAQAGEHNAPQGMVRLAVPAGVQPVAAGGLA